MLKPGSMCEAVLFQLPCPGLQRDDQHVVPAWHGGVTDSCMIQDQFKAMKQSGINAQQARHHIPVLRPAQPGCAFVLQFIKKAESPPLKLLSCGQAGSYSSFILQASDMQKTSLCHTLKSSVRLAAQAACAK